MQIVSIVNRKGGVGKTATAQALGAGLARRGFRVLFVDLDSQANLSYALGADPNKLGIMDVLTGEATAAEAIQKTSQGEIIAGTEALAAADTVIDGTGKEYRLKEALEGLKYDYIVIDTPAQLGTITINALTAASYAIIPVQAEIYSLQGIGRINDAVSAVKKYCNKDLYIKGILLTRYNGRAVLSRDMLSNLEAAAAQLNTKVYKTPIRECISVKEAQAIRQDVLSYAPKSNAAEDYTAFINEFLEDTPAKKKKGGK